MSRKLPQPSYKESRIFKLICISITYISLFSIVVHPLFSISAIDSLALFWIAQKLDDLEFRKRKEVIK